MRYDAYVSYCRSVDAHVARALREGLEQLARPGPGRRTLDVFLDDPARPVTADRGGPEPPWLDLRWARDASAQDGSVDLRNPRFHEAVTALAAPMHGIPRGEMEVRDFREYARSSRRRRAAMCGLAVLAAAALAGSCAGY